VLLQSNVGREVENAAMPNVELKSTRVKSSNPWWNLPCSTSFTEIQTSSRLEKKLERPVRTIPGTTARYPFATGLITASSAASLKQTPHG